MREFQSTRSTIYNPPSIAQPTTRSNPENPRPSRNCAQRTHRSPTDPSEHSRISKSAEPMPCGVTPPMPRLPIKISSRCGKTRTLTSPSCCKRSRITQNSTSACAICDCELLRTPGPHRTCTSALPPPIDIPSTLYARMPGNALRLRAVPRISDRSESNFELASVVPGMTPFLHVYREWLADFAILLRIFSACH